MQRAPAGVVAATSFFVASGLLEFAASLYGLPEWRFWPVWEALGRALLHLLLAAGLWHRSSLCRQVAMIYCLAVLVTYTLVLAAAYAHAPVDFPDTLVFKSLYEIPSCALLLPYLRSPRAAVLFTRP